MAYSLANYIYEKENNTRYAKALLQYNLEYYSQHVASLLLLGRIQLDYGNVEHGRELLHQVLNIDPENRSAKLWLKATLRK